MTPPPAATLPRLEVGLGMPSAPEVGASDLPHGPVDPDAAALRELDDVLATVGVLMARAVTLADRVVTRGAAEKLAGLPVDLWLSQVARQTRTDRNLLLQAVETLRDLPVLAQALAEGRVAWSQVVRIVYETKPLRRAQRQQLDRLLADAIDEHRAYAADDLVITVQDHVGRLRDRDLERTERRAERGEFLTLTPQLFGGGALYGEFGPQSFATIAEAFDADLPVPAPPGDDLDDAPDGDESEALGRARARRRRAQARGRARAERLLEWAEQELAGTTRNGQSRPARPTAFVAVDLDTLLGDRIPASLLTQLSGGRMKVSSGLARRLVDERGADVRLIVLDDLGEVIGVGRKHYEPPGWLREAIWTRDLTTSDPTGPSPIRLADLDHIRPWDADGPTDVTNLTAVSRPAHNLKTRQQLTVTKSRHGAVTWTTQDGTTITRPATRRPLDTPRRPWSSLPRLTDLPSDQLPDPPGDPPNP